MTPAGIVVGPLLRYVDGDSATVWVETDRQCSVEVAVDGSQHVETTWEVHGHHYAVVVVRGLEPGTEAAYQVRLDGHRAWPEAGAPYPPSVIRTTGDPERLRLAFGSCRRSAGSDPADLSRYGADALVALAERMMGGRHEDWPDAMLLVGDQVYADEPSPALTRRLQQRHDQGARASDHDEVRGEIVDFEEYTWLYQEAWRTPAVRWLLSTVPIAMILDDHDLRDDWNTSWSWRQQTSARPWFRERVVGALSSYWVYQHLGNLSPAALETDVLYRRLREAPDADAREQLLSDFAIRADAQPDTARWSFVRDFGRTRLIVVDSRCARQLTPGSRLLVDDREWAWVQRATDVEVDHLLIGTSLPVLLLHGIHHLEGWDEAVAEGAWGDWGRRIGERLRLAVDLEHWAAFRRSFDAMVELVTTIGRRPDAPASVLWLSGDMHCSYTARADIEGVDPDRTAMHQLTMSPFRNPLNIQVRMANRLFERRPLAHAMRWLARRAGVVEPAISWQVEGGPWFANGVMTVVVSGRSITAEVEHARLVGGAQVLDRTATTALTR